MTNAVSGTRKGIPTKEYKVWVAISSESLGKALATEAPQTPFDESNIASADLLFLTLPENPNGQFPLDFPLQCIVHGCPGSGKSYRLAENAKQAHYVFRTVFHPESRSEEHTSELQSLMRISYAVFCLKKKNTTNQTNTPTNPEARNKTHH